MSLDIPRKDTIAILERGIPLFRGGANYREGAEAARRKGHATRVAHSRSGAL